jgi:hypothetical protein
MLVHAIARNAGAMRKQFADPRLSEGLVQAANVAADRVVEADLPLFA